MPYPRKIRVTQQPGSSRTEIENEPDWTSNHNHRVGYRNNQNRYPGLTHPGDIWETDDDLQFESEAQREYKEL